MTGKLNESEPPNPIKLLRSFGQSVWLDSIGRKLIQSGELTKLILEDGLGGVTSNPAIFEKAMAESDDYTNPIAQIVSCARLKAKRVYEVLAMQDIQAAADALLPVYERTEARDGYVSLEVAPDLAGDTQGTTEEARRFWKEVDRPNLMIKIPATPEGLSAAKILLSEGINVNITLLFARPVYERFAHAYIEALTSRHLAGHPIDRVASVASFFISRIDNVVDAKLAEKAKVADPEMRRTLESLAGKVAVANAKLAYQSYKDIFSSPRWKILENSGAQTQRILWASTGTKNPEYRDVMYVEELIGPETVNTMPPKTLAAYREHGKPQATLETGLWDAESVLLELEAAGISFKTITDDLLLDGIRQFTDPFRKLLEAVERKYSNARGLMACSSE